MNYNLSSKIKTEIEKANKILINCHKSPDPDSVGSALAMHHYLKLLGKSPTVVSPDPTPEIVDFLDNIDIVKVVDFSHLDFSYFDLFIVLDSSSFNVVTGTQHINKPKIPMIVIDHHHMNDKFGQINLLDNKASSTGEILYLLFKDWKVNIDKILATNLLTAIIGDTGAFQYPGASAKTLEISAELIEKGTDKDDIIFNLYKRQPFKRYKLVGEILHNTKLDTKSKFIYSAVDNKTFEKLGADKFARNYAASNLLPMVTESEFGIVMVETQPEKLEVSFRARNGKVDVSSIASSLGGGGHKLAAGATIEGLPFEEAVKKVLTSSRNI